MRCHHVFPVAGGITVDKSHTTAYIVGMKTKLISADEAASILGVGPHAVRHLIRAGRLKAQLVGRQWIIDQNDLKKIQYGRPGPKPVTT